MPSLITLALVFIALVSQTPSKASTPALQLRYGVASFGTVNPLPVVGTLAAAGFDYIEPGLSQTLALTPDAIAEARKQIEASKIRVETMNWFLPGAEIKLTGPDADPAKIRAYVEKSLALAESFGAKVIVFGSPGARTVPDGFPRERAWVQLKDFLKICGDVIQSRNYGMVIGIEALRKPETNIINSVAEALKLAREVSHPKIRLIVDFYHLAFEKEDPAVILEAGDMIVHTQIADPAERTFPMADEQVYAPFFANLRAIGYRGRLSIEANSNAVEKDARASLAFLKKAAAKYVGAAVAGPQGAPPDPLITENTTVKLGPHTYVIPDANVGLVPNVGIVVGRRATLVIDPGLGRRNGETVLKEVGKVSKNTELYIASTHFHPEHTTGYNAFPDAAKYINSTVQEDEFAENGMKMVQTFAGRSPLTAELLKDASRRTAAITFAREHMLDLGGVRVRFHVVGPTHTKGDTTFFVEQDAVLFAGDVVMNNSFLAATAVSSMNAWLAAFDRLDKLKPKTIVPAHGAVGDGTLIAVNRGFMKDVQARAQEMKKQGRTADETATAVQAEVQKQHPGWPRANGLAWAARSAYAEAK
jgi:sugar phosphate isomerase/epimerase/glyoxylase-like metal-dependent hydrolase (beta-lactamase superfamily II)